MKSQKRANGLKWERRVGIFVLSAGKAGKRKGGIKAGEEVLVSYGKGTPIRQRLSGDLNVDSYRLLVYAHSFAGFWESRQMMAK